MILIVLWKATNLNSSVVQIDKVSSDLSFDLMVSQLSADHLLTSLHSIGFLDTMQKCFTPAEVHKQCREMAKCKERFVHRPTSNVWLKTAVAVCVTSDQDYDGYM